jgi:myo-inositol-1(or 4)-monophosphatase|tara:strand:- start:53808 stop:54608 length:801 start_codon:yes stop_codon:yes gene_type:complete
MDYPIKEICISALLKARENLSSLGSEGTSEVYGERVVDISTKGDISVAEQIIEFLRANKFPANLYDEELGEVKITENPKGIIVLDDIDGTMNYHRGRGLLPHCTVLTFFDSLQPKFKDAFFAGVIEHNSGGLWYAVRDEGCFFNGNKIQTSGKKILDEKTFILIDHYKKVDPRLSLLYEEGWVRDFGSAAFTLAGVSSGIFDAHIHPENKAHELGAGYLLIREAGGFLADWDGKSLDDQKYDFNAKYPIVAASTSELGIILLEKMS